jgi:hypothetical protein
MSCHNRARTSCDDFKNKKTSVSHKVNTYDKNAELLYDIRLTTSLTIACFLTSKVLHFTGMMKLPCLRTEAIS